jgi:long-chain acyl-CoA synthetase
MNNKTWLDRYEKHVPASIPYPDVPAQRFLTDTAANHPDFVAATFNELNISYGELDDRVNRFAAALQGAGIQKGDRVAFLLVNSPTYVVGFFAVLKIGAVVVNLNVGIQGEELIRCLNASGAKAVITLDLFAPNLYRVIGQTKVENVILHSVLGLEKKISRETGAPPFRLYQEVLASCPKAADPGIPVSPGDVAVLQYTSGSTGTPKAATLTHGNVVASVMQSERWVGIEGAGNAAVVCLIPFFHVFGMSAGLLISVLKGYRMILLPRMDQMDVLSLMKTLETYKPLSFPAVPSLWTAILSLPPEAVRSRLSSVQVATSGGAPLPSWVHERFENLTGRRIMEAYGLSEASSATHMTPYPRGGPAGSVGVPLPDTEAKIVDIQTGEQECLPGETGELAVKGPQIMRGYWGNKDLTAAALRGGWLYTGDLARADEKGFFYLVDRKDDLIISSGFNIYPSQIEEVLKRHPKIKDAGVIGAPDRIRGQVTVAALVLREGEEGDKDEILRFCRDNMPDYRVPKAIFFRREIPRDPAGKVLKRILKQEAKTV